MTVWKSLCQVMSGAERKRVMSVWRPNDPSSEYCPRFGKLAVELGYVTESQVEQALDIQVSDARCGRNHRVIGAILFEQGWMTPGQIEQVLNEMARRRMIGAGFPVPPEEEREVIA